MIYTKLDYEDKKLILNEILNLDIVNGIVVNEYGSPFYNDDRNKNVELDTLKGIFEYHKKIHQEQGYYNCKHQMRWDLRMD